MNKYQALPIALALLFATLTPQAVANRCAGEFSAAVVECSCAVQNRRLIGWRDDKVLSAFYAPDGKATSAEIDAVADVLSGVTVCDPLIYFMYSRADTVALSIGHIEPVLTVQRGGQEVRFYERRFRERK